MDMMMMMMILSLQLIQEGQLSVSGPVERILKQYK